MCEGEWDGREEIMFGMFSGMGRGWCLPLLWVGERKTIWKDTGMGAGGRLCAEISTGIFV